MQTIVFYGQGFSGRHGVKSVAPIEVSPILPLTALFGPEIDHYSTDQMHGQSQKRTETEAVPELGSDPYFVVAYFDFGL